MQSLDDNVIATDSPKYPGAVERFNRSAALAKKHSAEINIKYAELENYIKHTQAHESMIMKRAYEFVDWYVQTVQLAESSVCRKGCSHCCHNPTTVLDIEARYISNRTGIPLSAVANASIDKSGPCVFLKHNQCSVYKYRPMVCRTFFAFDDPSECVDSHNDHIITQLDQIGPAQAVMLLLIKKLGHLQFLDIREWFYEKK